MNDLLPLGDPRIGLRSDQVSRLADAGIVLARQFQEVFEADRVALANLFPGDPSAVIRKLSGLLPAPVYSRAALRGPLPPITGVHPPSDARLDGTSGRSASVARILDSLRPRLAELPDFISLTDELPPVYSQHQSGTCVGMSVAAMRAFFYGTDISGEFIYRGAKTLDPFGDKTEGTLLRSGLEFTHLTGAVTSDAYDYDDLMDGAPIAPLYPRAAQARIRGYSDLLDGLGDFSDFPMLVLAALGGCLIQGLGPRPVTLSTPIYPSMLSHFARETGLLHLPIGDERPVGGHAWVVVGAISGSHPDAPGGRGYFVLRNSWSRSWAFRNPLGLPGHALIPQSFLTQRSHVYECFIGLAEPSPVQPFHREAVPEPAV